jgi:DNA polymerase alpha subunit B
LIVDFLIYHQIGPFVDVAHPKIKNGDLDSTPASMFRSQIIDPLCAVLDACPGSIAVVVPSIRDIISRQAVFPQGEFEPELSGTETVSLAQTVTIEHH